MNDIHQIISKLDPDTLSDYELRELYKLLDEIEKRENCWVPNEGPQQMALECTADEVLFGGQAGGGKTHALCGIAAKKYKNAVIYRRTTGEFTELERTLKDILKDVPHTHNQTKHIFKTPDNTITLKGIFHERDKEREQGIARDFKGWDELTSFTESIYEFVNTWNRSADGTRVQTFATCNPPTDPTGLWIVKKWGPWVDPYFPGRRAESGEVRCYVTINGQQKEVDSTDPVIHKGEKYFPISRTFIRSRVQDNPYLANNPQYMAKLQALPEILRRVMLEGDFTAVLEDGAFQLVSIKDIRKSMEMWEAATRPVNLTSIGCDVARGGEDSTVIAPLYENYFDNIQIIPGQHCKDGPAVIRELAKVMLPGVPLTIDVVGVGSSPYDFAKVEWEHLVTPFTSQEGSIARDQSGIYRFRNRKTEAWWTFSEALHKGEILLPPTPDDRLIRDLTAPRYKIMPGNVIKMESNEEVKKRLGFSPDCGDAVVCAWEGNNSADHLSRWKFG